MGGATFNDVDEESGGVENEEIEDDEEGGQVALTLPVRVGTWS